MAQRGTVWLGRAFVRPLRRPRSTDAAPASSRLPAAEEYYPDETSMRIHTSAEMLSYFLFP